ncbi:MAG: phosphate propanoyltransferase [Myxococcota bacterium]|nr:phosphate propanoyltransferase [Myxococcota bacterium]
MDVLFGPGSELTPYKPLSQPGQFASEERVTIVGPRGRLERVRVLGPLRKGCQVEVSRTDEFLLGIDAPIRQSGHTKGSAPVTLEGPKGTLQLPEGLICAWRHIHMHPDDAEAYGVKDGDEVEVAVTGGPRDLVFGDVIVRVHPQFALEMHIDTDEANAAELSSGASGALVDDPYLPPEGAAVAVLQKKS